MRKQGTILIVEDNEEFLLGMRLLLKPYFLNIHTCKNPHQILKLLQENQFDVILLDMNFSASINTGNEGLYWMQQILKKDPKAVVVLITAYAEVELAVKAMQQGANSFLQKGTSEEQILSTIMQAYEKSSSQKRIEQLTHKQHHLTQQLQNVFLQGKSTAMQQVMRLVEKVANTDANILITGENGTGKSLVAEVIHRMSARQDDLLVTIDLAALPENLLESELFGYRKGAFTDAQQDKPGKIEIASGGTLFFDEIGNIPLGYQAKLLSVLQNRQVFPLGSNHPVAVDLRVISATNKPLQYLQEEGLFREDLLYRLNTVTIEIPPLRERQDDIEPIVQHYLKYYADRYQKEALQMDKGALQKLREYPWPGNVRELQHAIEKAVILADKNKLSIQDFALKTHDDSTSIGFDLAENEQRLILAAINKCEGNMSKAAQMLGITRATLYNKLNKYGIEKI